jgi:hypothetical protein
MHFIEIFLIFTFLNPYNCLKFNRYINKDFSSDLFIKNNTVFNYTADTKYKCLAYCYQQEFCISARYDGKWCQLLNSYEIVSNFTESIGISLFTIILNQRDYIVFNGNFYSKIFYYSNIY